MAFRDDLRIWAETLDVDPVTNTPQRLTLTDDLWDKGWLRENPVAAQHINQVLFLITGALKDESLVPANNLSDVDNAATARTNLGISSSAESLLVANDLSDLNSTSTARTNLGVNTLLEVMDAVYPVGSIYTVTGVATNPATLLGVGTWTEYGEGRVPIGVGTGSVDANGDALTITDGTEGGEVNHLLTVAEMPSHSHTYDNITTAGAAFDTTSGSPTQALTTPATSSTGGDTPHNNVQPWIAVRMWRRTA